MPVEKLLEAHLRTAGFGSISLTIETGRNAVWDEPSIDKLRRGDWAPWIKSIMIGVNDDEGTGYAAEQGVSVNCYDVVIDSEADLRAQLTTATGWKFVLDSFPEALRADIQRYYLPGGNETLPDPSNIIDAPATKVYGDQLFYHPVRDQVLAMANTVNSSTQQPVGIYLYRASVTTLSLIPAALGKASVLHFQCHLTARARRTDPTPHLQTCSGSPAYILPDRNAQRNRIESGSCDHSKMGYFLGHWHSRWVLGSSHTRVPCHTCRSSVADHF